MNRESKNGMVIIKDVLIDDTTCQKCVGGMNHDFPVTKLFDRSNQIGVANVYQRSETPGYLYANMYIKEEEYIRLPVPCYTAIGGKILRRKGNEILSFEVKEVSLVVQTESKNKKSIK